MISIFFFVQILKFEKKKSVRENERYERYFFEWIWMKNAPLHQMEHFFSTLNSKPSLFLYDIFQMLPLFQKGIPVTLSFFL